MQTNTIHVGDCLDIMCGINDNSIDLIATDPPFNTGRDFGDYSDKYTDYIGLLKPIIVQCHRILKPTGSLYLHCDQHESHYIKILLDKIFGRKNFRNDIRWGYTIENVSRKKWSRGGDSILFYVKSNKYIFNPQSRITNIDTINKLYPHKDTNGKYSLTPCTNTTNRPNMVYEWNGITRQWRFQKSTMEKYDEDGLLVYNKNGMPRRKTYLKNVLVGGNMSDTWTDIYGIPKKSESINYATQKPLKLYERIIKASSNEGDIVLDPFCGSGTTLVAAYKLGRRYIGIDINDNTDLIRRRLGISHKQ